MRVVPYKRNFTQSNWFIFHFAFPSSYVPVVHVRGRLRVELVHYDPLGQLHRQPVTVDGDLLHEVPALDPDLLLGHQVLDDHVRHVLAVGVPGIRGKFQRCVM